MVDWTAHVFQSESPCFFTKVLLGKSIAMTTSSVGYQYHERAKITAPTARILQTVAE